jgi:endonuclease YncB( thermonuclease family)
MFLLILAAGASALCANPSVHDGDTIRCGAERIRIQDIDAPELPGSPKCAGYRSRYAWCDYQAGYRSRDALQRFLVIGHARINRTGVDKYGRTLALITVNGRDAGAYLISLGLARRWR